jgi:VWFA-related protein
MPSLPRRAFLLSTAAALARAQQEPVFSTEIKVVSVLATVRDKKGSFVTNLSQDDFEIAEDNHPQKIRYFAREADLPLTIGLMVDTSASQRRVIDAERSASYRFFDRVLREDKDQAFIVQFDSAVQIKQALTSSVRKLDDSLQYVDTESMQQLKIQRGGGTMMYDAIAQASNDVMMSPAARDGARNQQRRRALILLTDGVDVGSYGTATDAISAAQRADTLVFSILYSDPGAYGLFGGPDGRGVLQRISSETGGGFFEVSKKTSIDEIYQDLETELRSQYNLGYVSDHPVTLSEFRAVRLTVKPKNLTVQYRHRYWAKV